MTMTDMNEVNAVIENVASEVLTTMEHTNNEGEKMMSEPIEKSVNATQLVKTEPFNHEGDRTMNEPKANSVDTETEPTDTQTVVDTGQQIKTVQAGEDVDFIIDEEFKNLLPPLPTEDFAKLEQSILQDGCHNPLVICVFPDRSRILGDGHNRYEICTKHSLSYMTVYKDFKDRQEALDWMLEHQKNRRNMKNFNGRKPF